MKGVLQYTCEDFSDQVFPVNQSCSETKYIDIFKSKICDGDNVRRLDRDNNICADIEAWLAAPKRASPEYLDPHNCTGSCAEPGRGCAACSNPAYFRCARAGAAVCLHPALRCNHHPDCDGAEDEDPDLCYQHYLKSGLIEKYATLKCYRKVLRSFRKSNYRHLSSTFN